VAHDEDDDLMKGKRGLIMGVAKLIIRLLGHSKALHAQARSRLYLSGRGAGQAREPLAQSLGVELIRPATVGNLPASIRCSRRLRAKWGRLDLVHAISFSDKNS